MSSAQAIVDSLERAIAELECSSSAEVVVSIVPQSGKYGDVDLLWGWLLGLITLAIILWSPWPFHPDFIMINVLAMSFLGWFISRRAGLPRRLLTTRARRRSQVEAAAKLDFLDKGVDQTSGRTGMLLYVSRLERALTLIPDRAVGHNLPPETLSKLTEQYGTAANLTVLLASLQIVLEALKAPLAQHLPRANGDVNELPDRPHLVER